ncbi:thioredoxin [Anaerorhabdus furcosa]|uniref:Thioredoxin n=1 Tax=Anaerorhabdus furcosa TaxID=118967 RepID=A0A1T4LLD5_9FIRM|nr:thioredoxin [Anaerorhabdus furcosa]SJZ55539.1 thioredoxin [Anaerorhabdus furcosa]
MSVNHLTKENFETEVLNSKEPVLVDFFATWCGPCKMLSPVIEEIANEAQGYKVFKLDVDEQEELAAKYGVMTIPTLIVFKNGQPVQTSVGFKPKAAVLDLVKNV